MIQFYQHYPVIILSLFLLTQPTLDGNEPENENISLHDLLECFAILKPSGFPSALLDTKPNCILVLFISSCTLDCQIIRDKSRSNYTRKYCIVRFWSLIREAKSFIPRVTLNTTRIIAMSSTLKIWVELAFTMSINKSYGQSFDKVGLFLTFKETIFTNEQLIHSLYAVQHFRVNHGWMKIKKKSIENIIIDKVLKWFNSLRVKSLEL